MPKYKDKEGNIHTFLSVTSKWNKKLEKFEDFDSDGNLIEMELVRSESLGFNYAKTNSMSESQKKTYLKERADKNFKESGFAAEKENVIKNMTINDI